MQYVKIPLVHNGDVIPTDCLSGVSQCGRIPDNSIRTYPPTASADESTLCQWTSSLYHANVSCLNCTREIIEKRERIMFFALTIGFHFRLHSDSMLFDSKNSRRAKTWIGRLMKTAKLDELMLDPMNCNILMSDNCSHFDFNWTGFSRIILLSFALSIACFTANVTK